jgi:hypothetical protein
VGNKADLVGSRQVQLATATGKALEWQVRPFNKVYCPIVVMI